MIPIKIQIKNFLSYGSLQVINFEPYSLICLSGKNGHGKSALLDALTWAVWGQARKTSGTAKADEGLMHLGQTHMMVCLDFVCNGIAYRVRREHSTSSGKSFSNLEFGILDTSLDAMRPLTDKTIRATQEKIEALIGLDYETFINSAFLRQGQSQEFSKKTPKERKEILVCILGLYHYETLRRVSLDKVKELSVQKEQSAALIYRFQQDLAERPRLQEQLDTIAIQLSLCLTKEQALQAERVSLLLQQETLVGQKRDAEKVLFQKHHLEEQLKQRYTVIQEQVSAFRRMLRLLRQRGTISYEDERVRLQEELQTLQYRAAQKIQLTETFRTKQEALRQYVQSLQEKHTAALENIQFQHHTLGIKLTTALQKKADYEKMKYIKDQELSKIAEETAMLYRELGSEVSHALLDLLTKKLERRKASFHTFISKANSIASHLKALKHKKELVHTSADATCPLCEQPVANTHALEQQFEKQEHRAEHQLTRLSQVTASLKKMLIDEHAALEALKRKAEQQKVVQVRLEELTKQKEKYSQESLALVSEIGLQSQTLASYTEQQKAIDKEKNDLQTAFQAEQKNEQLIQMKAAVVALEQDLEKIVYNPAREKQIHERLQQLSLLATEQAAFVKEATLQEERKKNAHMLTQAARALLKQMVELAPMSTSLESLNAQEIALKTQEQHKAAAMEALTKEKETLLERRGALQAQIAALNQRALECKKEEITLNACSKEIDEYTILSGALSKDGIQALLIEDALPEIEHEANALLAQLTDNQAHLTIESLRDLKSGKAKETLDIKISDAAGIRPYELFSGGEAFRIDFALRIALSKLLARRSGTALQTLIIDEGFGSQDEEGLSHIIEALRVIQDDFAKIIVVSHLPTLKEQFPVHFLVRKTAEGSSVTVIENC